MCIIWKSNVDLGLLKCLLSGEFCDVKLILPLLAAMRMEAAATRVGVGRESVHAPGLARGLDLVPEAGTGTGTGSGAGGGGTAEAAAVVERGPRAGTEMTTTVGDG